MIGRILALSMSAAVATVLYACDRADLENTTAPIVAPVNAAERVMRIDSLPPRNDHMAPERVLRVAVPEKAASIDQELLARAAIRAELDRDLRVAQEIGHATREILAQAYIERAMASASPASADEISRFYKDNPALFGQRRIYRVLELVVAVPPDQLGALQDALAHANEVSAVARWLESRGLAFEAAASSRSAERIPMHILPRLFAMQAGEFAVFPSTAGATVVQLEQSADVPLSEEQASPAIARYLFNSRRMELVRAEIARLRERAKSEQDRIEPVLQASATQSAAGTYEKVTGTVLADLRSDSVKLR
ncbi:MAG TPA: EpsD family peptidyl-prolyl cis-trans isomerase [Burkholderiales bacterium]|nr:EpsD family peptidyl-prolyl cis-trans isomerase [Burkholderiales bacterium]